MDYLLNKKVADFFENNLDHSLIIPDEERTPNELITNFQIYYRPHHIRNISIEIYNDITSKTKLFGLEYYTHCLRFVKFNTLNNERLFEIDAQIREVNNKFFLTSLLYRYYDGNQSYQDKRTQPIKDLINSDDDQKRFNELLIYFKSFLCDFGSIEI